LAEGMVAMGVGITFLAAVAGIFVNCSLSFAEVGNYVNMDRKSRNALDRMTRNIRNAKALTGYTASALVFNYDAAGVTNLAYRYDASAGNLNEEWTVSGTTTTTTLLTGCNRLTFSLYDRDLAATTDASVGKAISIAWECLGTVVGRTNREYMQQAQVVIRNQP
jgi:Tfp pilus assembly protein PilW